MYTAALVMSEQLKAVGMNAELLVLDWPASVQKQQNKADPSGWNFFFTGYGTNTSLGGAGGDALPRTAVQHLPAQGRRARRGVREVLRRDHQRQDAGRAQGGVRAGAGSACSTRCWRVPFGTLTKVQAVRANVEGFRPFRIPRMSNVWLKS